MAFCYVVIMKLPNHVNMEPRSVEHWPIYSTLFIPLYSALFTKMVAETKQKRKNVTNLTNCYVLVHNL